LAPPSGGTWRRPPREAFNRFCPSNARFVARLGIAEVKLADAWGWGASHDYSIPQQSGEEDRHDISPVGVGHLDAVRFEHGGASNFCKAIIPDPTELTISSPDLFSARLGAWTYGPRRAAFAYSHALESYLPSFSIFFFSSSFIPLIFGSWLVAPVV
jgi:hypothetical protein